MSNIYQREYFDTPSAWKFMLRAPLPKKGFMKTGTLPQIVATWKNCKPSSESIMTYADQTGIQCDTQFHPLFLHTISCRLIMSVLTDIAFPEPIWSILQVRNTITQRRGVPLEESFDLVVKIADHRVLHKGLEIDLQASISVSDDVVWESMNTFYIRGKFGASTEDPTANAPETAPLSQSIWHLPAGGGKDFASLTGDYNGIHLWNWYAKMFGFKAAFSHPQRVLGQIFKQLLPDGINSTPLKIETWLKGPVYYGSKLELKVSEKQEDKSFSLHVNDARRPAIIGTYSDKVT